MEKDTMETMLECLACRKETRHRIHYGGGMVRSIRCEECGVEVGIDPKKALALYGEELVTRVLTKPARMTKEYEKSLMHFFAEIPFRIATKPYRMFKEFRSLSDDDGIKGGGRHRK